MTYTLYASGDLIDATNPAVVMEPTPILERQALKRVGPPEHDEKPRKIKSTSSLSDLMKLQHKLKSVGFDVFIERI